METQPSPSIEQRFEEWLANFKPRTEREKSLHNDFQVRYDEFNTRRTRIYKELRATGDLTVKTERKNQLELLEEDIIELIKEWDEKFNRKRENIRIDHLGPHPSLAYSALEQEQATINTSKAEKQTSDKIVISLIIFMALFAISIVIMLVMAPTIEPTATNSSPAPTTEVSTTERPTVTASVTNIVEATIIEGLNFSVTQEPEITKETIFRETNYTGPLNN